MGGGGGRGVKNTFSSNLNTSDHLNIFPNHNGIKVTSAQHASGEDLMESLYSFLISLVVTYTLMPLL